MNTQPNTRRTSCRRHRIAIEMQLAVDRAKGYPTFTVHKTNAATRRRSLLGDLNMAHQLAAAKRRLINRLCDANMKDYETTVMHARTQQRFLLCLANESFRYQKALLLKACRNKGGKVQDEMLVFYRQLCTDIASEMSDPSVNNYVTVLIMLQSMKLFASDLPERLMTETSSK